MITFTMILQLCIVLGALWVGSRYGSLALGAISGIGLAILVFGFGLKPGQFPDGRTSAVLRLFLQHAAYQDEGHNHSG